MAQYIKTPIPDMKKKLDEFLEACSYVSGQYDQDDGFEELEKELKKAEETYSDQNAPKNRVFYMALPPSVFTVVAAHFKKINYSEGGINRIIVEKPFGKDLESSREMQEGLKKEWKEDEVRAKNLFLRLVLGQSEHCPDAFLALSRSSVLTTTSERRWSKTCSCSDSPTSCSTRRSTRTSFRTFRSRSRSRSGPRDAADTLTSLVSSATSCKTVGRTCPPLLVSSRTDARPPSSDLLQVLSILTMERPVSFSSEDIRDEKVRFVITVRRGPPLERLKRLTSISLSVRGTLERTGQGSALHP